MEATRVRPEDGGEGGQSPVFAGGTERRHVLIVEMDEQIRELLADALLLEGYRVTAVKEIGTASSLVMEAGLAPDVMLVDVDVPQLPCNTDGGVLPYQRRLGMLAMWAPVIAMTTGLRRACAMTSGVGAIVEKPFDLNTLLDTVAFHAETSVVMSLTGGVGVLAAA
jgi:DNA-binding NtrC family response regulator